MSERDVTAVARIVMTHPVMGTMASLQVHDAEPQRVRAAIAITHEGELRATPGFDMV